MQKFSKWFVNWWMYFFYALLMLAQVPTFFDPKAKRGDLIQAGIFCGVYAGGILMALWGRMQAHDRDLKERFRQQNEQFERQLWRIKTEAEIRAKVGKNRPTQNASYGTSDSTLEDYQ